MKYLWMLLTTWILYYGRIDVCVANGSCEGRFMNCCEGFMFDFQRHKCIACEIGFFGVNCSMKCPNSTFGRDCQSTCACYPCHHATGCTKGMTEIVTEIVPVTPRAEYETKMVTHSTKRISTYSTSSAPQIQKVSKSQPNSTERANEEQDTVKLHHGLYVIVSTNTLLTLPITVAVILYICRKMKSRKSKPDTVDEIYFRANIETCYNDLNEIHTVTKSCDYDALPVGPEDFRDGHFSLGFLDDVQRKTRANSYVPVRERKPKENDERINGKDDYTKVKKNFSRSETDMRSTTETSNSMDSQSSESMSNMDNQYIVPLTPTAAGPGIGIKSVDNAYLSVPTEDAETLSNGSVVYTELI